MNVSENKNAIMNLPNILTIIRMVLVPVLVAVFYLPNNSMIIAAAVFFIAYLTDTLDGMIARKYNIVTNFGKLMDPMADKMLTAAAMVMLCAEGLISPVAVIITLLREFAVSAFRLISAKSGVVFAAEFIGKAKTVAQFLGILLIMLGDVSVFSISLGDALIWISVALAVISGVDYIYKMTKTIDWSI